MEGTKLRHKLSTLALAVAESLNPTCGVLPLDLACDLCGGHGGVGVGRVLRALATIELHVGPLVRRRNASPDVGHHALGGGLVPGAREYYAVDPARWGEYVAWVKRVTAASTPAT